MLYTIASRSLDRLAAGYRRDVHDRRVRPCAVGRRPRVVRRRAVERPPLAGIGASNREHETMFGGVAWKARNPRSAVGTRDAWRYSAPSKRTPRLDARTMRFPSTFKTINALKTSLTRS